MKKSELVNLLADRLPYLTRKNAEIIVVTILESMVEALAKGDRIAIRGFGSFAVKNRPSREGRNPKTGETIPIPAKRVPRFKISKEFHGRINRIAPE